MKMVSLLQPHTGEEGKRNSYTSSIFLVGLLRTLGEKLFSEFFESFELHL